MITRTVSEALRTIDPDLAESHNLELYAQLFENCPLRVREFVASGSDSVVLRLENGSILKLSKQKTIPDPRPWAIPIIDQGIVQGHGHSMLWFIQPAGTPPVAEADFVAFLRRLRADGYRMVDPSLFNLAYYKGEVKLIDPFAVIRISEG